MRLASREDTITQSNPGAKTLIRLDCEMNHLKEAIRNREEELAFAAKRGQ